MSYIPVLKLSYDENTLSGTLVSLVFDYNLSDTEEEELELLLSSEDLLMSVCRYTASILYTIFDDSCTQDIQLSMFYDQCNELIDKFSESDEADAMQDLLDSSDLEKMQADYNELSETVSDLLSDFMANHCPELEEDEDTDDETEDESSAPVHTINTVPNKEHPYYTAMQHQQEYDILLLYINDETSQVTASLNTDVLNRNIFTSAEDFYSFILSALKLFIGRLIYIKYEEPDIASAVVFRCLSVIRDVLRKKNIDPNDSYDSESPLFEAYMSFLKSEYGDEDDDYDDYDDVDDDVYDDGDED